METIAVGRRNWTFAGSDEGGRRAAAIYTLIATGKLNDIDPQAWLADVLARLPDHPAELLPWNWRHQNDRSRCLSPISDPPKRPNQGPSPDAYFPALMAASLRRVSLRFQLWSQICPPTQFTLNVEGDWGIEPFHLGHLP
jgi:hypothetical protein